MRPKQCSSQKAFRMGAKPSFAGLMTHAGLEPAIPRGQTGSKTSVLEPFYRTPQNIQYILREGTLGIEVQVINVSVHLYQKIAMNSIHLAV